MMLNIIFALSGLITAALITAKVWEEKRKRKPYILRLVSLGDERSRALSHELAHRYSELKGRTHFFINKQLPLHTRSLVNKAQMAIKERAIKHIGDIRGSRFLKKSDGLNEFFKNISEKESGRIDDTFDIADSQERGERVK